ncbi:MAG: hypothetical protein GY720_15950 [bacterium]|nr:hypothetical protein [bacterium]
MKRTFGPLFTTVGGNVAAATIVCVAAILGGVYYLTNDAVSTDDITELQTALDNATMQTKINERLLEAVRMDLRVLLRRDP